MCLLHVQNQDQAKHIALADVIGDQLDEPRPIETLNLYAVHSNVWFSCRTIKAPRLKSVTKSAQKSELGRDQSTV